MGDHTRLPEDKAELMARIQREWDALIDVTDSLGPEQMGVPDEGGWSIKDNLAHITEWERYMRLHYLGGVPSAEALGMDKAIIGVEDEMNAILFQRNRDRAAADVLAALHSTHDQVLVDLEQTSPAELMNQFYDDDPEARSMMCFVICNTYDHYREHRETIEKALGHGESTPGS